MADIGSGFIKDSLDLRDYTYLHALIKLAKESKKLGQCEIKFGLWTSRDREGQLQPASIDIGVIHPGCGEEASLKDSAITIKTSQGQEEKLGKLDNKHVLVPLNILNFQDYTPKKIELKLPPNYSPPKDIFSSLSFDGKDDYVEIPSSESINFDKAHNFTVEAWVKVASSQTDTQYDDNDIIEKWDGSENRISSRFHIFIVSS